MSVYEPIPLIKNKTWFTFTVQSTSSVLSKPRPPGPKLQTSEHSFCPGAETNDSFSPHECINVVFLLSFSETSLLSFIFLRGKITNTEGTK